MKSSFEWLIIGKDSPKNQLKLQVSQVGSLAAQIEWGRVDRDTRAQY